MNLATAAAKARGGGKATDGLLAAPEAAKQADEKAAAPKSSSPTTAPAKAPAKAKAPAAVTKPSSAADGAASGGGKVWQRFVVELKRGDRPDYGFLMTPVGNKSLEVHSLRAGENGDLTPVGVFNSSAEKAGKPQLREGDLVLTVNEIQGDIQAMWKPWRDEKNLRLDIYRPPEMTVRLNKIGPLNINIKSAEMSLFLEDISPGPFLTWNDHHHDQQIFVGDRIVSINGKRLKSTQLLEALKAASGELELVVAIGPTEHRML